MSDMITSIRPRRLWWIGPLTTMAAIIGVLIVRITAVATLHPDPQSMSLG